MGLLPTVPPDEYARALSQLRSVDDLASLLGVNPRQLRHYSYGKGRRYRRAEIQKRRGGVRRISQPTDGLKALQAKIALLLSSTYRPRDCVHGFVDARSIATNAAEHSGRRWVFNVDLEDFFPSINFGRVRGRLMVRPFSLPGPVATVIAQLCCWEDELPQGAPSSPVLSNIVSSELDSLLSRVSRRYGCKYTRYADDLTFSTDRESFPEPLGAQVEGAGAEARVGSALEAAIGSAGFRVNGQKVRLQRYNTRQVVTGLIVNEVPNVARSRVRRVRAMLRAWQVHGYDAAEEDFFALYDNRHRPFGNPAFRSVVKGNIDFIGMVRGNTDTIYLDLIRRFQAVDPSYVPRPDPLKKRSHLPRLDDALWVIESDWGQGTAFELEGIGLVTCSHALRGVDGDEKPTEVTVIEAWQPRAPNARQRATLLWQDAHRDIAVMRLERPSGRPLAVGPSTPLPVGHQVEALGFPKHSPGAGMWRDSGTITRHEHHIRSPRYMVSFAIVSGASGSPVLDSRHRVVGVASMGADSFEEAAQTQGVRFGVIPVGLLLEGPSVSSS
jgi:RNA-directed DNA polymerase